MATMGKAARNEQRKLLAAFINNAGVGFMIGGFFLPLILFVYGNQNRSGEEVIWAIGGMVASCFCGLFSHWMARNHLKDLED
jgi:hypothetical protein